MSNSRKHLINTPEILVKDADRKLTRMDERAAKEREEDKAKGLDVTSSESIEKFDLGYTPLGSVVLVKEMTEEQTINGIIIPDMAKDVVRAIVIETGYLVTTIKKGDIVTIKPAPQGQTGGYSLDREIKGIKFKEHSYQNIAGVFLSKKKLMARFE